MLGYIEYLGIPTSIAFLIVGLFFILQIVGELLEAKGKIVPEFLKIRKYFQRRKKERQALAEITDLLKDFKQVPKTLKDVQELLNNVNSHYSSDNIAMRDKWIQRVNDQLCEYDKFIKELIDKLDKNNEDTLSIKIDNKRSFIIDFAEKAADLSYSMTKEQFKRFFKVYEEYENIIEENHMTNGEVDIAYRIAVEAYEDRLKNHSFIEDVRGY